MSQPGTAVSGTALPGTALPGTGLPAPGPLGGGRPGAGPTGARFRAAVLARLRALRVARITPLGELLAPPRMTAAVLRIALQVTLAVYLWRGLYAHSASGHTSGLNEDQAVSYAVLAVLAVRIRTLDRRSTRDNVFDRIYDGTIVYWYLRPMPPRRYYALRGLGEQAYGLAWVALGYAVCRALGIVQGPASAEVGLLFLASLLLGQYLLYQLGQLTDLACFWLLQNSGMLMVVQFAQNLLSGAYAPLWYFPGWFVAMSTVLPFGYTLNTPLSLYIGRIAPADAPRDLAVQAAWALGLALLSRLLWRRAGRRVVAQGG